VGSLELSWSAGKTQRSMYTTRPLAVKKEVPVFMIHILSVIRTSLPSLAARGSNAGHRHFISFLEREQTTSKPSNHVFSHF